MIEKITIICEAIALVIGLIHKQRHNKKYWYVPKDKKTRK